MHVHGSRISLFSARGRSYLLVIAVLAGLGYLCMCGRSFYAYEAAQSGTLEGLSAAAQIDEGNAEYWSQLGIVRLYQQNDPDSAIKDFQQTLRLNPRDADSWMGIASADQLLARSKDEREAISRALNAAARRPEIAWQAANLYVVLGDSKQMTAALCTVVQHDPRRATAALDLAHRTATALDCSAKEDRY